MALTPNLSKIRVTGSFVDSQGAANSGSVTFQLSTYLIDPVFNQIVTNQPITCTLDNGTFSVDLVATNDPDLYPSVGSLDSVVWNVTERITGLAERKYPIKLDYLWKFYDLADLRDLAGNVGVGTGSQDNTGGSGGSSGGSGGGGTVSQHATTHAVGGSDPLTPDMIGAAPVSEVTDRINAVADLRSDLDDALLRIADLESGAPTTFTPPGQPTNVSAVAGDGRITIAFTPPVSNGGSEITGYRVGLSDGTTVDGLSSPISATGLTNGKSFYVSVVAFNAVGASVPSEVSGPIIPVSGQSATVPDAPTGVAAAMGSGQAVVSFVAPNYNGGSPIVGYKATASSGQSATGPSSPLTITGLTNGSAVNFTVVAINAVGESASSLPSQYVTPASVPNAPTSVVAVSKDGSAQVSWVAPTNNGGSSVLDYTATASSGQTATVAVSPTTVTGLANGNAVTFTVRARNAQGSSVSSAVSNVVTPAPPAASVNAPTSPTNAAVTVGAVSGQATLSWAVPVNVGSSAVTGYTVTRNGVDSTGASFPAVTVAASNLSYVFSKLVVGSTYTLTVSAVNAAGSSTPSTVSATIPDMSGNASGGSNLFTAQQESVEGTDLTGFTANGTGVTISRDVSWASAGTWPNIPGRR